MARSTQQRDSSKHRPQMVLQRRNYLLLTIGIVLIVAGFTAMRLENELKGFISLYVAPLMILGGYLEIIYAILWRPASERRTEKAE